MASENETIAEIIAEMRERAEAMQTHGTTHGVKLAVLEFSDRIEAAAKREAEPVTGSHAFGNAAAMREALLKCREIALQWQADEADGVAGTTDKPQARSAAEAVIDMEFEINAALAAPARQCDVGTAEEQDKRFSYKFCRVGIDGCVNCKLNVLPHRGNTCGIHWAQMPYEAKEGGAK